MNSTVTATSPKFFPEDFKAHVLDRIGRNAAEVDDDAAKVGCFLRESAHQPDVAALQPDLARPAFDAMAGSALDEIITAVAWEESLPWPRPFSDLVFNRCRRNVGLAVVWRCSQSDDRDLMAATCLLGTGARFRSRANRSRASRCCPAGYHLSRAATVQGGFGGAQAAITPAQGDTSRARQLAAKCGPTGREPAADRRYDR